MSDKVKLITASAICIALSGFLFINSHTERIMSIMADYYFRKNDVDNAIKYYENAFELGYEDPNARDTYVNLIINSPLDAKTQEKIVKFIAMPVDDAAKLKAEYFVDDIKHEILQNYPGNFISQAPYNQKIVRWSTTPITYGYFNKQDAPAYFVKMIEAAMNEWEKATNHVILFGEDENPNIIIKFNPENPAGEDDKKYIVAYTSPTIENNNLKNMHIEFYLKDPKGDEYSENQVYNTALHELGHALGFMGHSDNPKDVMYISKDTMRVTNDDKSYLTEADINTIELLYNIKPDITNNNKVDSKYLSAFVVGDEKEVMNAKIKEAKRYIKNAPNISSGYIDLAEGYTAAKDYRKALKCLNRALELATTTDIQGMVYYNLAVINYYLGDYEAAKNNAKKAIQIKDDENIRGLLAEIYAHNNEKEKAVIEYTNLINAHPDNINYTIALTNIYIKNLNYISARRTLKNYIQNNPSDRNNIRLAPYGIVKLFL